MLFNSIEFVLFLSLVFVLFWGWASRTLSRQNLFLLVASYVFYGWWDWRFLGLIFISSSTDFLVNLQLSQTQEPVRRRLLLAVSLGVNLGMLGYFKYANFFIASFADLLLALGFQPNITSLNVILPVGISFYTFQSLSYTLDVYRGKLQACKDPIRFYAFISFFPQLVAGPIEKAHDLLPQFNQTKVFDLQLARTGLRYMLWGLMLKVILADSCAIYANQIFGSWDTLNGGELLLGALYFTFQIYGDFAGYSYIALGTAALFGFHLSHNFRYPYFSRDIAEFWRRWHISLSTWFRDYLYIPLGGSRGSTWLRFRNTMIIFLVSGLWHGANWTFVAWGGLHALFFLPLLLLGHNRANMNTPAENTWLPRPREAIGMAVTFGLVVLAWVFFRADNIEHAFNYLLGMFSPHNWSTHIRYVKYLPLIPAFLAIEWLNRHRDFGLQIDWMPAYLRWPIYYACLLALGLLGQFGENSFIYFQF